MPRELKHTVICRKCEAKGEISPLFKGITLAGYYYNKSVRLVRCVKCLVCGYSYIKYPK